MSKDKNHVRPATALCHESGRPITARPNSSFNRAKLNLSQTHQPGCQRTAQQAISVDETTDRACCVRAIRQGVMIAIRTEESSQRIYFVRNFFRTSKHSRSNGDKAFLLNRLRRDPSVAILAPNHSPAAPRTAPKDTWFTRNPADRRWRNPRKRKRYGRAINALSH
jgi:hypothetical protein